jgi:DNA (cytosine-5)-methyltransferase 1
LYWTNFNLPSDLGDRRIQIGAGTDELKRLCEFHKIDISTYKGEQSMIKVARNLVDFEAGKTILETALGIINKIKTTQTKLF